MIVKQREYNDRAVRICFSVCIVNYICNYCKYISCIPSQTSDYREEVKNLLYYRNLIQIPD